MWQTDRMFGFAIRLAIGYALLVVPWPGLRDIYATAFRACGNVLFASFGPSGSVRFVPADPTKNKWDTETHLYRRGSTNFWRIGQNSRYTGYLPTITLIVLVLATPVTWSRRGTALVWGLLLVHGFVACRLAVSFVYGFRRIGLFDYAPSINRAVEITYEVVAISTVTSHVIPALIWVLVMFRRSDWAVADEPTPRVSTS